MNAIVGSILIATLVGAIAGCSAAAPPPGGAGAANTTPRQNAPTVETPGQNTGTNEVILGDNSPGG